MSPKFVFIVICALIASFVCAAQNSRVTTGPVSEQLKKATSAPTPTSTTPETKPQSTTTTTRRATTAPRRSSALDDPTAQGVLASFEALVDGIRRADVDAVTSLYWESPQLTIFNNNGTITRTWEQMRSNRASSYADVKNVSLEISNRNIHMMGREGAIVTCQWTQAQTFRGTSESASGRLTVVYRRINSSWKIIHTHTSPDAPDRSRLMPSERITTPTTPTPTPQQPVKP